MILLSSTHRLLLAAKDEQIRRLMDEVAFLRNMVQPKAHAGFVLSTEANGVLDGRQDQIDVSQAEDTSDELISERGKLLSGTYDA